MTRVVILGSTGSIGRSTLRVCARHPDRFRVVGLAAHRSAEALAAQAARHDVDRVVLADPSTPLPEGADGWERGREALLELAAWADADVVVNALVGAAGLEPTLAALDAGHRLALANKESLVAGGALVLEAAGRGRGEIVPIDSEHSAILQCLEGAAPDSVARVVLTASGGPFRGRSPEELRHVRPEDALQHPTWDMGAKITIDSATLANKALEIIEAHYLYRLPYERIDAVVHPQSVIHSFVEFVDGSVLAQLGFPTMELPILYALSYPERVADPALRTFDPVQASPLTFEPVDEEAFPLFALGRAAGEVGGAAPAAFNAGNEIAVQAFLKGAVGFGEMAGVVEAALRAVEGATVRTSTDVFAVDAAARRAAHEEVARRSGVRAETS